MAIYSIYLTHLMYFSSRQSSLLGSCLSIQSSIIDNNNNNIQDNVVHLMNVERRQVAADPRPSQTT